MNSRTNLSARYSAKFIPVLSISWWRALGGSANVVLAQTDTMLESESVQLSAFPIPLLLSVLVPISALNEEYAYRCGSETLSVPRRLLRQLRFGLLHLIMGIPMAAGLALTLSGQYYEHLNLSALKRLEAAIQELRVGGLPELVPFPDTCSLVPTTQTSGTHVVTSSLRSLRRISAGATTGGIDQTHRRDERSCRVHSRSGTRRVELADRGRPGPQRPPVSDALMARCGGKDIESGWTQSAWVRPLYCAAILHLSIRRGTR